MCRSFTIVLSTIIVKLLNYEIMKKQTAYLIISVLLFTLTALGQNQENDVPSLESSITSVNVNRSIKLDNDSKTEEIIIDIKQNTKKYALLINSSVSDGKLTIEFYDPNGTKQGNFTISTQLDSEKNEKVSGNINKSLTEPQAGKWKIKIIPANATGNINISTAIIE